MNCQQLVHACIWTVPCGVLVAYLIYCISNQLYLVLFACYNPIIEKVGLFNKLYIYCLNMSHVKNVWTGFHKCHYPFVAS